MGAAHALPADPTSSGSAGTPLRVLYVGNFEPEHSTENHVARALRANGHNVTLAQESPTIWAMLDGVAVDEGVAFVLWTHTHGLAPEGSHEQQWLWLHRMRHRGIPTVAYHLDRWWGLKRQHQAEVEPFFRCDLVCTADGGHDDDWEHAGVEHVWYPPAVSAAECEPGIPQADMASPIAFVGSWQGGYHPEWAHRAELVRWLDRTYRGKVGFWPKRGHHAIRGVALRNLYASVRVCVGDSCLVGGATRYLSDRVPETIGRGGFLIHPRVEGVTDGTLYTEGEHLACWDPGDWNALKATIDRYLDDDERYLIATQGRAHVLEFHTYERRVSDLVELLTKRGHL